MASKEKEGRGELGERAHHRLPPLSPGGSVVIQSRAHPLTPLTFRELDSRLSNDHLEA